MNTSEFGEANKNTETFESEKETKLIRLKEIVDRLYGIEDYSGLNMIVRKSEDIRSKYPDYQDYRLYHLAAGSTPKSECPKFDFPGEDSIELFLEEAESKLNSAAAD